MLQNDSKDIKDMTPEEIRIMCAGALGATLGASAAWYVGISYLLSHHFPGDTARLAGMTVMGAGALGAGCGYHLGQTVEQAIEHPIATKEKVQNFIRESMASGSQKIRSAIQQATDCVSTIQAVGRNGFWSRNQHESPPVQQHVQQHMRRRF